MTTPVQAHSALVALRPALARLKAQAEQDIVTAQAMLNVANKLLAVADLDADLYRHLLSAAEIGGAE